MKIRITKEQLNTLKNINRVLDEVKLTVDDRGLSFREADSSMICLTEFNIKPEEFDEFENNNYKIGVNLEQFIKSLRVDEDNTLTVKDNNLIVENKFTYELPQLELPDSDLPPTDNLEYDTEFKMEYNTLREIINEFSKIEDKITIRTENNKVIFTTESDIRTVKKSIDVNSILKEHKSSFPLEFLNNLFFHSIKGNWVTLKVKTDYPLTVIGNHFKHIIAPRITE